MRVIFPLALSTLCVTGCGSDGNNDGGTTDTGPTYTVPELTFKGAVNAKSIDGNLSENTVLGHKAAYMYAGSLALAAADEGVQERLAGHGSDARDSHCWIAPVVPLSNFTLDYSPCTDAGLGISGGMIFNEDPLGPVSLAFQSMTFDTSRTLSGAVGLDLVLGFRDVVDGVAHLLAEFAAEVGGRSAARPFGRWDEPVREDRGDGGPVHPDRSAVRLRSGAGDGDDRLIQREDAMGVGRGIQGRLGRPHPDIPPCDQAPALQEAVFVEAVSNPDAEIQFTSGSHRSSQPGQYPEHFILLLALV